MNSQDRAYTNKGTLPVILCFGFFTMSVQALLFRDFLYIYEGTELAVGFFFFAWFLWIALGALTGKLFTPSSRLLQNNFDLLLLLYIPAYVAEYIIILNIRMLCGITPYELFPLIKMVPVSFIAMAPVSFCTGLFFTIACKWTAVKNPRRLPVAFVYIAEVSGGCAGGIYVTLSLSFGMAQESVFLFAALFLCTAVFIYRLLFIKAQKPFITWVLLCTVLCVMAGAAGNITFGIWTDNIRKNQWSRLLPAENYQASFSTSQGLYHYGEYKGIFTVISWGTVCESYPDTRYGAEIAALHLVQNPGTENILVIGQGALPVCREFFRFPHIKRVVWATPDPSYARELIKALPSRFHQEISRLEIHNGDIKNLLLQKEDVYDLVIIHLPGPTTLVLNRYFTQEFYQDLKQHMTPGSVLSVQTKGGENYLGSELVRLGASVFQTLKSTFSTVIIKPGEQSWLLASDGEQLTGSLPVIKKRYEEFQFLENIFPVQGLDLLYKEDRAAFQHEKYDKTVDTVGKHFLVNTAVWPKAMLHSLLFSLKQAGTMMLDHYLSGFLVQYGFYIVIGGILLYCLFRSTYALHSIQRKKHGSFFSVRDIHYSRFDNLFLIFSAGLVGISVSEVLIFFYQHTFGSLYLHIGLISALFMFGLCTGGILIRQVLLHLKHEPWYFLPAILMFHLLLLFLLFRFNTSGHSLFYIILFFVCGAAAGCYIPVAVFRFKKENIPDQDTGAVIELSDHLGAASGSLLTGVLFIPLAGAFATLIILCFLLGINLVFHIISFFTGKKKKKTDAFTSFVRVMGYCCAGLCLFLVTVFLIINTRVYSTQESSFSHAALVLANGDELEQKNARGAGNLEIPYYMIKRNRHIDGDSGEKDRYIFSTEHFAPGIAGYSGPIILAVFITGTGELLDYTITGSTETPVYLDYVSGILPSRLIGKNIFDRELTDQVDTVTGATMTSAAIIHTLSAAGTGFAQKVLGKGDDTQTPVIVHWPQVTGFIILFLFIIAALILRKFPSLWIRRGFLFTVVILCGVILNIQYSTDHLFRLGLLPFKGFEAIGIFILITGIPLVVLLCGNVYCGYLCPFGALQELIGDLRPAGVNTGPDKNRSFRFTRYLKYLFLFFLVIAAAATMNPSIFLFDPLIGFFRLYGGIVVVLFCMAVLVLSFFYPRVWCRNLCPVGAFLSLVSRIRLLRFLVPHVIPRYCDLGVVNHTDLDCICCDRCRIPGHQKKAALRKAAGKGRIKEWVFCFIIVILVTTLAAGQFLQGKGEPVSGEPGILSSEQGGNPRDVDMELMESLIQKGYLSDHESEFYKEFKLDKK